MDYGYVNGALGPDGQELDVFVGGRPSGLVGLMLTADYRRGDEEFKLLYDCSPEDVYLANGFLNFDRSLMEGWLVLRRPLHRLWEET